MPRSWIPDLSRVVILEGVEGSGKTTVAKHLEKKGWGYVHFGFMDVPDLTKHWIVGIKGAATRSKDGRVIVDRLHMSHQVYEPITHGWNRLSDLQLWFLEGWLLNYGGDIHCLHPGDLDYTVARLKDKFGGWITRNQIFYRYNRLVYDSSRNLPSQWGPNKPLDEIAEILDREHPPLDPSPGKGLGGRKKGAFKPRYWLLCKEPLSLWELHYIHRAIRVMQLRWNDVRISTIAGDLRVKHEALGKPAIVALGADAAIAIDDFGLSWNMITRPKLAAETHGPAVLPYAQEFNNLMKVHALG